MAKEHDIWLTAVLGIDPTKYAPAPKDAAPDDTAKPGSLDANGPVAAENTSPSGMSVAGQVGSEESSGKTQAAEGTELRMPAVIQQLLDEAVATFQPVITLPGVGKIDVAASLNQAAVQVMAQTGTKLPLLSRADALLGEAGRIVDGGQPPNDSLKLPGPTVRHTGQCCTAAELNGFLVAIEGPRTALRVALNAYNDSDRAVREAGEQGKRLCQGSLAACLVGTAIGFGAGGVAACVAGAFACINSTSSVQNAIRVQALAEQNLATANGALERALGNYRFNYKERCDDVPPPKQGPQPQPPIPPPPPPPAPQPPSPQPPNPQPPKPQPQPPPGPQPTPPTPTPGKGKQPTLRPGDQSPDGWVEYAQQSLIHHGYPLKIDGIFGPKTEIALRDFQGKHQTLQDGIIGNQTWSLLREGKREDLGTDHRKPHTFEEKGAQARLALDGEGGKGYVPEKDRYFIWIVSVGEQSIDHFNATVKVTHPEGSSVSSTRPIGPVKSKSPNNQGNLYMLDYMPFRSEFGLPDDVDPLKCAIEMALDDAIGGDTWSGPVLVAKKPPA